MRRVLVIGSGGAGKSTFAARLGERTGLPVVHLDTHYWRPGWRETPRDEWAARVEELISGDAWVIDGNYSRTLDRRLAACDTVVFLDMPRRVCLWRVFKRRLMFRDRARPDMNEGCRERLTWEFLRWVWTYPRERRPRVLEKLQRLGPGKRFFHLRSTREARDFLEVSGRGGAGGGLERGDEGGPR